MLNESQRGVRFWSAALLAACLVVPLTRAAPEAAPAAPDSWARSGKAALEDGQFELAEKWFRQGLAGVAPRSALAAEARLGLARAAYGKKAFQDMLEVLPVSEAPAPGEALSASYRYHRALALYELGRQADALVELDSPGLSGGEAGLAADANRLRAWILLKQAKWPEAARAFSAWEAMPVPDFQKDLSSLEWAEALMAAGRLQDAESVARRTLSRKPVPVMEWKARHVLARILNAQGQLKAAETELDLLTGMTNVTPAIRLDAWLTRSDLEENRTNWTAACSAASNAVALAATPVDQRRTRTTLGRLLLRNGALREGADLLQAVIAGDPADPQAPALQLALARAFLEAGRADEAETNYRYYLESFTNSAGVAEAREGRAWALLGLERFAEAAAVFEKAADAEAGAAKRDRLLYKAGDAYFANNQFQLAAERYKRVMESGADPVLVREADFQTAETEARLGHGAEAQAHFSEIEKREVRTELAERAALRKAELLQDAGSLAEAGEAYDRFLAVFTNTSRAATALYNRGLVAYQVYRFETALADFTAVATAHTNSPHVENAAYMRVCTAFELFNDERAARLAQDFLQARPTSTWAPQVLFRMAEYQFNRGVYEKAEEQFKAVADQYPKDRLAADALFWAARAAAAAKQYKRAVELDTLLIGTYPDHPKITEAQFYQAESLVVLGDYPGAIALLDDVIKRQPDAYLAFAAKGRRGDAQFTLGADDPAQFEGAIKSYTELAENPKAPFELRLQAAFKIGRGFQKLGRMDDAFEQFYQNVILVFLEARQAGTPMNEACTTWFTQASFEGAGILESQGRWREAVRLYQRVADAGVAAAPDALRRIESIRREHWRFF